MPCAALGWPHTLELDYFQFCPYCHEIAPHVFCYTFLIFYSVLFYIPYSENNCHDQKDYANDPANKITETAGSIYA